jgi:hypothetical protein
MSRLILFISLCCLCFGVKAEVIITSSEVYSQVLLIEKETELVKRHFNSNKQVVPVIDFDTDIKPRHVWQKAYMLQIKLVAFRRKQHLEGIAPVGVEPSGHIDPRYTWGQTQRVLTEIRIIRKVFGIQGEVGVAPLVEGKKPVDVFNKLAQIEAEWDAMTEVGFDPSYVFSQILRLSEDVNMVLRQLDVFDSAMPPAKNPSDTPADSLAQAFLLLEQVQRLQKSAGLEITDLSAFRKTENVIPTDVFNMVCLIIAELQQIKDRVGLKHDITPPATYHESKKPADVRQFLGYVTNKLALIQHL